MRGTQGCKGHLDLGRRDLYVHRACQRRLDQGAAFVGDATVVRFHDSEEVDLRLVGDPFDEVDQVLNLRREFDHGLRTHALYRDPAGHFVAAGFELFHPLPSLPDLLAELALGKGSVLHFGHTVDSGSCRDSSHDVCTVHGRGFRPRQERTLNEAIGPGARARRFPVVSPATVHWVEAHEVGCCMRGLFFMHPLRALLSSWRFIREN